MHGSALNPGFGPPVLFAVFQIGFPVSGSVDTADILDYPSPEWENQLSVSNLREK